MTDQIDVHQFNFAPAGAQIPNFTGATSQDAGVRGLVPPPAAGDNEKFLRGDGTWGEGGSGSGLPPVTASDNGKTVIVVSGDWAVAYMPDATQSASGLMSAADKTRLDAFTGIQAAAGVSF